MPGSDTNHLLNNRDKQLLTELYNESKDEEIP